MELGTIEEVELIVDQIASNKIPPPNKAQSLVIIRQMMRMAKQVEAQAKEIAELRYGNAIKYGTSHPEIYKTELDCAKEEIAELNAEVERKMSAAAFTIDKYKALCDQMGAALEETVSDSHAALEYMREAYGDRLKSDQDEQAEVCKQADEALTAWRESNGDT